MSYSKSMFRYLTAFVLAAVAAFAAEKNLLREEVWEMSPASQIKRMSDGVFQLNSPNAETPVFLTQDVVLGQKTALALTFGADCRNIENDSSRSDSVCSVHISLTLDDGSVIPCIVLEPDPKRRDWESLRRTYQPPRPVSKVSFVVSLAKRAGIVQCKNLFLAETAVLSTEGMKSYGIGVASSELRHCVGGTDAKGRPFVLAAPFDCGTRKYLLYTELDTGKTSQYFLPANDGFISGAALTDQGKYVCGVNDKAVIFDVNTREVRAGNAPAPGITWSAAIGNDGTVYLGNTPATLFAVDPATGAVKNCGRVDPEESQLYWIAVDKENWVYCGTGMTQAGVVAYQPATGEMRQLVPKADRVNGTGLVQRNRDGRVFISTPSGFGAICLGGRIVVEKAERPPEAPHRHLRFGSRSTEIDADRKIVRYDMNNRTIVWSDHGTTKTVPFEYESGGVMLTSVGAGPDGRIYLSSGHPHHLCVFDPATNKLTDLGAHPKITGGNFCNMTPHRGKLYACSYPSGQIWEYDPQKPASYFAAVPRAPDGQMNPRILGAWTKEIMRPRVMAVHPNGRELVIAGFSYDGLPGGQFGVHDLETGKNRTIEKWLPGESCIAALFSPEGDLLGGTSIEAIGGHVTVREASVFQLDWKTGAVAKNLRLPGAINVPAVALWLGKFLAAADNGTLYVVDPASFSIERQFPIGAPVRNGLLRTDDDRMILVQGSQISELDGESFQPRALARSLGTITGGGAVAGNRIFFIIEKIEFHEYTLPAKSAGFERRILKNALPRPAWWRVRPAEIMADCAAVKQGKLETLATTPGGFPVLAVAYGTAPAAQRAVNWPSATGSPNPGCYAANQPQVVMIAAGIHGEEPEGVVLASNLISLLETGRDRRGVEKPRLLELCRKYRLLVLPCVNMDGRAIAPDNALGSSFEEVAEAAYTRLKDGRQLRWPALKEYFPMPMDQVAKLGTYYNADGYNIQLDAAPGNIRTAEAKALLRLADRERIDGFLNLHSAPGGETSFVIKPSSINYPKNSETVLTLRRLWMEKINVMVDPDPKATTGQQSDINNAVTLATGAVTLTFEFASMKAKTFDELLETGYAIVEVMLEYGLKKPLADRKAIIAQ